jgi:hypothetical protein
MRHGTVECKTRNAHGVVYLWWLKLDSRVVDVRMVYTDDLLYLLYLSAQLTRWYTLTGAVMVESGQLIAQ